MFAKIRFASFLSLAILFTLVTHLHASTISGSFQQITPGTVVNLSEEGMLDWIHWGTFTEYGPDRKAGVEEQISDFYTLGIFSPGNGPFLVEDNPTGFSWYDGQPDVSVINTTNGIYEVGTNFGVEFTAPADTTTRVLKVYVGAFGVTAKFVAHLSDGDTYTSTNFDYTSNGPSGVYTLTYTSDSPDQTLTIDFMPVKMYDLGYGNVTLQAAALSYATNNNPPTIALRAPADNAIFQPNDPILMEATAFDKDGSVTNVQYFVNGTPVGQSAAYPYSVTWSNVVAGEYWVSAQATDNAGAVWNSRAVEFFIVGTGGSVSGSFVRTPTNATFNLTVEGQRDWAHWGLTDATSYDHKAGISSIIPTFTVIGDGFPQQILDFSTAGWSWQSGTPTSAATNSHTYVFMNGYTNGFELQLPAGTARQTVKLYVGLFAARGKLEAFLDDYSSAPFVDTSLKNLYDQSSRTYTISYTAASNNRHLIVRYTADSLFDTLFGSVSLMAAAVTAPYVEITNPTDGFLSISPSTINVQANATNVDGAISAVDFLVNDVSIGQSTTAPFNLDWVNPTNGLYTLTTRATDVYGRASTSAPVNVIIREPAAPIPFRPATVNGTNIQFSFSTLAHMPYVVEYTDSLSATNWQVLTNINGSGIDAQIRDAMGTNRQRYYRLLIGP